MAAFSNQPVDAAGKGLEYASTVDCAVQIFRQEGAAAFRVAVGSIVLAEREPEPEPELEPEPEPEPEPETNPPWSALLSKLGLCADERLAEVGKTEDDETRRLRIAILDAEQEEDKMAAADQLIAQLAAKDAEIEQLKAQLAEIQG